MYKIFISHSSKDLDLVNSFVKMLQLGMNLQKEEIFYSSKKGTLPSGEYFVNVIKKEIVNCKAVIFILTESYLKSHFCLAELGAAWALGKKVFPFLVSPTTHYDLEKTPFLASQCLDLFEKADLGQFCDEIREENISGFSVDEFNRERDDFLVKNSVSPVSFKSQTTFFAQNQTTQQYIDFLTEQAQTTDEARLLLGMHCWEGILIPQDGIKARELFTIAATNGYAPAMYHLSSLYYKGDAGEQSFKKSYDWALKAKTEENLSLAEKLGFMYQVGLGCDRDLDKAIECFNIAISSGDKKCYWNLGEIYSLKGEYPKAVGYYTKSVESGYKFSALCLGKMFNEGRKGIPVDCEKAAYYFEIAAQAGITEAKYRLGQLYYFGHAVFEQDFKAAFRWFAEAADDGDVDSQYNLGYLYQHGLGVERNDELAIYWAEKAALRGHQLAQVNVADIYSSCKFRNYEKAIYWYTQAANQNSADAHRKLGDIFLFGLAGEVDQIKAINHYRQAADQHDKIAQLRLKYGKGAKK